MLALVVRTVTQNTSFLKLSNRYLLPGGRIKVKMPENLQTTAIHQNMECDVETGGKSRDRVKSSE